MLSCSDFEASAYHCEAMTSVHTALIRVLQEQFASLLVHGCIKAYRIFHFVPYRFFPLLNKSFKSLYSLDTRENIFAVVIVHRLDSRKSKKNASVYPKVQFSRENHRICSKFTGTLSEIWKSFRKCVIYAYFIRNRSKTVRIFRNANARRYSEIYPAFACENIGVVLAGPKYFHELL